MSAIPSAIVFVNNDLTQLVQKRIENQLHITTTLSGEEFDRLISINPNYRDYVKQQNSRILVIRSFYDRTNRDLADIVIFVKEGMAAVECKKIGPPGKTLLLTSLYYGNICYY